MSMRVFKLEPDMERFTDLAMVHEPDIRVIFDFDGTSLAARWRPYAVSPITEEFPEQTEVGDFTSLGTIPVFSERAVAVLGELLSRNGELLPLECSACDRRYYAYNVVTVIDALDRERTKAEWFDSARIMIVDRYAFQPGRLRTAEIFRIPQQSAPVFITDVFMKQLSHSGLDAFAPKLVWTG